jgi:hypothetical protein
LDDYVGKWLLLAEDGNRYSLEFGKEIGDLNSYRVTIVLTCRDAFTLVETFKNGVSFREQHRFVRVSAAPNPP